MKITIRIILGLLFSILLTIGTFSMIQTIIFMIECNPEMLLYDRMYNYYEVSNLFFDKCTVMIYLNSTILAIGIIGIILVKINIELVEE